MGKKKEKGRKYTLMMGSVTSTISLKVYDEQLPEGWEHTKEVIESLELREDTACLYQVLGIKHDRCLIGDDFWKPAVEKPHYHIIARVTGKNRIYVAAFLKLLGVVFREGVDDIMIANHGCETVGNFSSFAMYLTHETEQALLDGKTVYDFEEIVSNLCPEAVKSIRAGYVSVRPGKATDSKMASLESKAYELGKNFFEEHVSFEAFKTGLSYSERKSSGFRLVEDAYYRGLEEVAPHVHIERLCVFISGGENLGKTHAIKKFCESIGKSFHLVDSGSTGKFDSLTPAHGALIVNDYTCETLTAVADSHPCKLYRRGSHNPWFCGDCFFVSANSSFEEWLVHCGTREENVEAVRSRFFVCHVECVNGLLYLVCDSPCVRGTIEERLSLKNRYLAFRDFFIESIRYYASNCKEVPADFDLGLNSFSDGMLLGRDAQVVEEERLRLLALWRHQHLSKNAPREEFDLLSQRYAYLERLSLPQLRSLFDMGDLEDNFI